MHPQREIVRGLIALEKNHERHGSQTDAYSREQVGMIEDPDPVKDVGNHRKAEDHDEFPCFDSKPDSSPSP